MQKVIAAQDDSSHWYVFPAEMNDEWNKMNNELYDSDFEDEDLIQKFEEKFSKYRTGGDLNNKQLYAEL